MSILGPWESDREKKALRPRVDLRERSRLALKALSIFLAYRWFEVQELSGAAAAAAFAGAVAALSAIELVWLRSTTQRERIFTKTKEQAVRVNLIALGLSVLALVAAVSRLR